MREKQYLEYGEKETAHLRKKDPALARVMDVVGPVRREVIPDVFMALVNSVIGQQISTKAHRTVWERAQAMFAPLTPEHVASIPVATLQTCGISTRKAVYINEIATSVVTGALDLAHLHAMDDEAVCKRLSEIRGIGVWTAEMLMTFSMRRMDVLSWGDLAILRGLRMLYRHRVITPVLFAKYKKRYSPYATVASLYLWALAGGACEGYADPAPKTPARKKIAVKKAKTAVRAAKRKRGTP
ncbi:HhH-GPD superfamily base excision DNA repair protein [uncultured delta proteobacterium]|uniref:DNA-3-methyladenine glycosylase II n=1 Tax=uncultured delta proteobacterium TaxID=34034 RepID=A0A212JBQ7_9DELT|nr:HhH-GPD superfamily base excision DNA repair protein [uncultured delta proteobacterium]